MRHTFRSLTIGLLAAAALLFTSTAHAAYPDPGGGSSLTKESKIVYTTSCPCSYWDAWDGTYFKKDKGGMAVLVKYYKGGKLAGKVELHPYGQWLYVYDTLADGSGFKVDVTTRSGKNLGTYQSPSQGYKLVKLSTADNTDINLKIHRTKGGKKLSPPLLSIAART